MDNINPLPNIINETSLANLFLSPEWVYKATKVVQEAKLTDEEFGRLVADLSLDLVYQITDIPAKLSNFYQGNQVVIFVRLKGGAVKKILADSQLPEKEVYFTVTSQYHTFKRIYLGEINPATAFVNRQIKVEPLSRVYRNPRLSARSIIIGNKMLKILRQLPTLF